VVTDIFIKDDTPSHVLVANEVHIDPSQAVMSNINKRMLNTSVLLCLKDW